MGLQRYPWELRVSGDGGACREGMGVLLEAGMSPGTGGALAPHHLPPQLSASTATMRSTEPSTARWISTGRAVQAGGPQLRVIVDSVPHKRPVTRVTFYRHLRDLQIVRP